jgi:hypothetical protein
MMRDAKCPEEELGNWVEPGDDAGYGTVSYGIVGYGGRGGRRIHENPDRPLFL